MWRSLPASGQAGDRALLTGKQSDGGRSAEGFGAFGAGAISAEIVVAEDTGGMAVVETNLDGVVPYLRCGLCAGFWLVHGEQRRGRETHGGHVVFLGALVVARGAGAKVAEVGKVVVAGMAIRPGDIDAGAGLYVNFDAGGLFALIDGCGHGGRVFSYKLSV
jgi:hypothetical protein